MLKKLFLPAALLATSMAAQAQLAEGRKNINKLCGCFDIDFKYAETFAPDAAYKFHDREELAALEMALPVEQTDRKIVIQHLLVINDSTVIKHWREDWEFESPYLWKYAGDKKWVKQELKPEQYKGKWTQTVWEVDDAPRYQGISEWVTTDGKTFWQSTTDAPLPRREYSVRSDYNLMRRGNRLVLTDNGWTHEQDNEKIIKKDGRETLLAQEKGYNIYKKEKETDCARTKEWWAQNGAFWTIVRAEWGTLVKTQNTINLQAKVDNKSFTQYLEELMGQWKKKQITQDAVSLRVKTLLQKFTDAAGSATAKQ